MASVRWIRALAWALVVLAVVTAIVNLLFVFGNLLPEHDLPDLVERMIADRGSDTSAFPIAVIGSLASIGVFLIAALLGVALRGWAPESSLLDAMAVLFLIGGVIGIGSNLMNIATAQAATYGYCDCGYKTEEVISLDYALSVGRTMTIWLNIGAVTLVGVGVALAGRLVDLSPAWRTLSYLIAVLLIFAVALRVIPTFVFVESFDPYQLSDLATALAAGILVPIWAILLARGVGRTGPDDDEMGALPA
jgi:drug/metabolite transporter (DMT)-like permease